MFAKVKLGQYDRTEETTQRSVVTAQKQSRDEQKSVSVCAKAWRSDATTIAQKHTEAKY